VVPLRAWAVDAHAVIVRESEYVRVWGLWMHSVGGVYRARSEIFGSCDLLFSGKLALISEYAYAELLCFCVEK